MSSFGAISGFSIMSYQTSSRMMLDAQDAGDGEEDGELAVESANNVEVESQAEDGGGESEDETAASLGGQLDAWG